MAFFRVMLEGRGIELPFGTSGAPAVGFFTTRQVAADDACTSQEIALTQVRSEWLPGGEFAEANRGSVPELLIEDCWEISKLTAWFKRKPRGYSFFSNTDD